MDLVSPLRGIRAPVIQIRHCPVKKGRAPAGGIAAALARDDPCARQSPRGSKKEKSGRNEGGYSVLNGVERNLAINERHRWEGKGAKRPAAVEKKKSDKKTRGASMP